MTGRPEFRLRVGDYRVIYDFDTEKNEIIRSLPNGAVSFLLA